ncbi:hypothetical protein ACFLV9_00130 [Chloroflexota bacterium]
MAISEKQHRANKENAKKGGVKTKKGKIKSRLNAIKHGMLLTSQILLEGEDVKTLATFRGAVMFELVPRGELELILVDRFVTSFWRLRRIMGIETNSIWDLYNKRPVENPNLLHFDKERAEIAFMNGPLVEKILRYETTIERQMYKALDKFIELREKRTKLANTPGAEPIDIHEPITVHEVLGQYL